MDIQQLCKLCPRPLCQSGKRCADSVTVTKTPCAHYFHPACWERYYKKNKTTSEASCPCPTCHRMVTRDALREITVSRDPQLLEEDRRSSNLRSAAEEARLQRAAAELEKRSREKQNAGQGTPKKVRRRKQRRDTSDSSPSGVLFPRMMKVMGKALLVLGILALLGKCYWDQVVIERFNTWDEVMTDKANIFKRMREIFEHTEALENMTSEQVARIHKEEELNAETDNELYLEKVEMGVLAERLEQRNREAERLIKWGMNKWQNPCKLAEYNAQKSAFEKLYFKYV